MVDWNYIIAGFISLLAILDPLAIVPIYLTLFSEEERRRAGLIAATTALTVLITLTLFFFLGHSILTFFGISLAAFRVSGGIILFIMGLQMLEGSMSSVKRNTGDGSYEDLRSYAIVPLAIPLLSGPGAISAVVLLGEKADGWANSAAMVVVFVVLAASVYGVLRLADQTQRVVGPTGIRIFTRVMGLLLAAVAAQFIADGLLELFPILGRS